MGMNKKDSMNRKPKRLERPQGLGEKGIGRWC